ncbi:hypothetical protein RhiJN_03388 [Ceratobasidium sp. AG-Ba]|nr:hypothetical protein RhiJN_03388 [Ceratobasidium sp. AG-Ba]
MADRSRLVYVVETPQHDDASTANHTICIALVYIGLIWVARYPFFGVSWALGQPTVANEARLVCTFTLTTSSVPHAQFSDRYPTPARNSRPFKAIASAVKQIVLPSDTDSDSADVEALTEARNHINQPRNGSLERSPSPGRISRVIAGLAQADISFDLPQDVPLVCLSCGRPTLGEKTVKHPRGKTELAVQDEQSIDPTSTPDDLSVPSSPIDVVPLFRTLKGGLDDLPSSSSNPHDISMLHVLVIAKNDDGGERPLTGPNDDAGYLRKELGKLPNVRFKSILDFDATFDQTEASITELWKDASEGSHLMVLSSGHGIDNRMHLWGDKSIDEQDIQDLAGRLYDKYPK